MRPAAALTVLSCLLVVAGCGGSDGDPTATSTEPGGGSTLEELWRAPGDDVAVIPGTENHEPGNVRVSFLVADAEGRAVTLPTARVWVANALDARPFLETEAKLERIGVCPVATRPTRRTSTSQREAAARRQVLAARRAGGRQHQGAGAREHRRRRRRTRRPTSAIALLRRRRRRSHRPAATSRS